MRASSRLRVRYAAALPRHLVPVITAALAVALAGCTIPTDHSSAEPAPPEPWTTTTTTTTAVTVAAPAPVLAGRTVFLDPGHSGSSDTAITAQVPTGRGDTKDCQSTGTATDAGYPEHTFTWQVVELMRGELEQLGARVLVSRADDTSVGSCVDERATMANTSGADAVVAVHADGAGAEGHGFHVSYSAPALNDVQAHDSVEFATTMRDALVEMGMTPSTYLGSDGIMPRADLAGLNLSARPSVLVELGNMRNPDEARTMTDAIGRAGYAQAVVHGIVDFLDGR